MLGKKFNKNELKFRCEKCDYSTCRKSQYERHLQTKKHINKNASKQASEKVQYFCSCGKKYNHDSSYYRHKKTCKFIENTEIVEDCVKKDDVKEDKIEIVEKEQQFACNESIVRLLQEAMSNNKALQEQMIAMQNDHENAMKEQNQVIKDFIPKLGNTTITNSNNKIINVNMFLNEKCADAMSIQNFANQLLVTMDDLSKSKKDCISNVVLKNLKPLSLTQRPFHCTNVKNKEWYVKDETEGWEEDNGEKLIKTAEYGIQKKWTTAFEQMYPDWMRDTELRDKYIEIAGSTTSELPEKIKLKLLRELASESTLGKKELCQTSTLTST